MNMVLLSQNEQLFLLTALLCIAIQQSYCNATNTSNDVKYGMLHVRFALFPLARVLVRFQPNCYNPNWIHKNSYLYTYVLTYYEVNGLRNPVSCYESAKNIALEKYCFYFFPLGLNSSIQLRSRIIGFTDGLKYSCP